MTLVTNHHQDSPNITDLTKKSVSRAIATETDIEKIKEGLFLKQKTLEKLRDHQMQTSFQNEGKEKVKSERPNSCQKHRVGVQSYKFTNNSKKDPTKPQVRSIQAIMRKINYKNNFLVL